MKQIYIILLMVLFGSIAFGQTSCITSFYTNYCFDVNENGQTLQTTNKLAKCAARIDFDSCQNYIMTNKRTIRTKVEYDSVVTTNQKYGRYTKYYYNGKENVAILLYYNENNIFIILFDGMKQKIYLKNS